MQRSMSEWFVPEGGLLGMSLLPFSVTALAPGPGRLKGEETERSGDAGVYYQFEYFGTPQSYKWLSSNSCVDCVDMAKSTNGSAWPIIAAPDRSGCSTSATSSRRSSPLIFAMAMAWEINSIPSPAAVTRFFATYGERESQHAAAIGSLLMRRDRLMALRRPEHIEPGTLSILNYREAERIVVKYTDPKNLRIYIELRVTQAKISYMLFDDDFTLSEKYYHSRYTETNETMSSASYTMQRQNSNPIGGQMGVVVECHAGARPGLRNEVSDRTHPSRRDLIPGLTLPYGQTLVVQHPSTSDLYREVEKIEWSVADHEWVTLSRTSGTPMLEDDEDHRVKTSSSDLPRGRRVGHVSIQAAAVPLDKKQKKRYEIHPVLGCGATGGVALWPSLDSLQVPPLSYTPYLFSDRESIVVTLYYTMELDTNPTELLCYDISFDDTTLHAVRLLQDPERPGQLPAGWYDAVQEEPTDEGGDWNRASAASTGWIELTLDTRGSTGSTRLLTETVRRQSNCQISTGHYFTLIMEAVSAGFRLQMGRDGQLMLTLDRHDVITRAGLCKTQQETDNTRYEGHAAVGRRAGSRQERERLARKPTFGGESGSEKRERWCQLVPKDTLQARPVMCREGYLEVSGGKGRVGRANQQGAWGMSHTASPLHLGRLARPPRRPLSGRNAQRSSSSLSNTIIPFDVKSFTTDNHQQTWLPTPPPPQPLAPPNSTSSASSSSNNLPEDFVLFPPTPAPRPPARPRDERAPAPSTTALRSSFSLSLVGPHPRRHSVSLQQKYHQQQFAGVPRVTRLVPQSTGFPLSTSYRFSPSSRKHTLQRFYAASVPSNSPQPNRPPVPLFHSTGNLSQNQNQQQSQHRRVMSSNIPQDLPDLFDLSTNQFIDEFEVAAEPTMFSQQHMNSNFTINDPLAGAPAGTVSPKDLMVDASAPPSTSFTDLSTPSFESPGYFSQDTSPMFPIEHELAPGHEEWESLFPVNDGFSTNIDDLNAAVSVPQKSVSPPSPMIRSASSPGQSSGTNRNGGSTTKHSSVSGVGARRREKPLPPIKYDANDPVAVKRARNTEAARKSRARKLERQEEMERRIAELEKSLEESQRREQYWKALAQSRC
ncbi:hypothetical protein VTN00DRAFT_454 [Thermoascus crustaceus]|uniref:uncharacterized protein n=1 Tax=Thermoascus crustaceus TaxID=5088 RepID=UPI003742D427